MGRKKRLWVAGLCALAIGVGTLGVVPAGSAGATTGTSSGGVAVNSKGVTAKCKTKKSAGQTTTTCPFGKPQQARYDGWGYWYESCCHDAWWNWNIPHVGNYNYMIQHSEMGIELYNNWVRLFPGQGNAARCTTSWWVSKLQNNDWWTGGYVWNQGGDDAFWKCDLAAVLPIKIGCGSWTCGGASYTIKLHAMHTQHWSVWIDASSGLPFYSVQASYSYLWSWNWG
jgi:hypothetical protein